MKLRFFALSAFTLFFLATVGSAAQRTEFTPNVMAPLLIGDATQPNDPTQAAAWASFDAELTRMKSIGVFAVSTDVWWGIIEPQDGRFQWEYYDKLAQHIQAAGLKWIPILSFHQCGGNVGDQCNIPIPAWIWTKYLAPNWQADPQIRAWVKDADSLKYKSEQGHVSPEYVSAWATFIVLRDYRNVMEAFQAHFANAKSFVGEINISLGPAGELRYPSYNSHDQGTGYPTRGGLQAYSELAIASFRSFALLAHGGKLENVAAAWGLPLTDVSQILPPLDPGGLPPNRFFAEGHHRSPYGSDFFFWYNDVLVQHGKSVLGVAASVFGAPGSPFRGIDIGAKVPGVHWRIRSDRLAELSAGLINIVDPAVLTQQQGDKGPGKPGYEKTLTVFSTVYPNKPRIVLHFTCLEKANFEDGAPANSLAKALVFWLAQEADRQGIPIKGENALAGALEGQTAWDNLDDVFHFSSYRGLTILRMGALTDQAWTHYSALIQKLKSEMP